MGRQVFDRTKRTPEREVKFLEALKTGASVYAAARIAGIGRQTAYDWRNEDDVFAALWEEAVECGTDLMEDEAKRRGMDGYDEPVFYQGQVCGKVRRYSDFLLDKQLRARRKGKYSDRQEQVLSGQIRVVEVRSFAEEPEE
jgi:hypothetical protein